MPKSQRNAANNEMKITVPAESHPRNPSAGFPNGLDPVQVERAATALVSHMKQHALAQEDNVAKRSLAADDDENADVHAPIFLNVSTKQHVKNKSRLKPSKIHLPYPILNDDVHVCLFTKDPQRAYKDLIASDAFPSSLRSKIRRVVGLEKLKKKWKSFESKRQLFAEHDVFLVDDRIAEAIVPYLGKTFYAGKAKRPVPIRLTAGAYIDSSRKAAAKAKQPRSKPAENVVGTVQGVAKEIETALHSTYVSMSASANTSIKVGKASMSPSQLSRNIEAVAEKLVNMYIEHKWSNVRGLYIKGLNTKALPIWLAEALWVNESHILDGAPTQMNAIEELDKGKRRTKRKWEEWEEEMLDDEELTEKKAERGTSKKSRRRAVHSQAEATNTAATISREKRIQLKRDALTSVQTPLVAG